MYRNWHSRELHPKYEPFFKQQTDVEVWNMQQNPNPVQGFFVLFCFFAFLFLQTADLRRFSL